jgi:glutaryl-CoA dehydrogenase (non-decarboxylating)
MNFEISEQQHLAKMQFDLFVEEHVILFADKWDERESMSKEIITKLAAAGFLGATSAKKYGGLELDPLTFGLLCEAMGKGSMSLISLLTVHGMVYQTIAKWGADQHKAYWLPKLAKGECIAAFALSEPNVGSDPKSAQTTAVLGNNGKFILNGKKKWISCGQIADLYLVIAQCDGHPTTFLLERSNPGLTVTPINGLYGFRSAMLAELTLNNCELSESDIIGKVGFGFSHVANSALDYGRYSIGWGCVGLAQGCLDASLSYAASRKQFGVSLRKHQLIQQMLADMAANVRAARALCLQAAYLKSNNEPDLIMETSIAKYFASKTAVKAANDAVQIHGANGCSNAFPVQRYLRDAKVTEIIEGSSQIQQIIISQYAYQRLLIKARGQ